MAHFIVAKLWLLFSESRLRVWLS